MVQIKVAPLPITFKIKKHMLQYFNFVNMVLDCITFNFVYLLICFENNNLMYLLLFKIIKIPRKINNNNFGFTFTKF